MKVLVIGSGGREHAFVWKLRKSPRSSGLFCAPGNPGIGSLAECIPLKATDLDGLLRFARSEGIGLTVVGPEQPLADGIVDLFERNGLRIFGPTRNAAELEWSKEFAKEFMRRNGIPTARHITFSRDQLGDAKRYVHACEMPVVLKADGLAAGKGVVVCQSKEEALQVMMDMLERRTFGSAGERVIVEEFLVGEEASVFAICDGSSYVTLAPAQDHKRALDEDRGKNTGGMGAYAPAPGVTNALMREVERTIIEPTLRGMGAEGRPYKGCLYVGLMLTMDGPKVVEFNCRFGDPETQVVLPLYDGDILELLLAAVDGEIGKGLGSARSIHKGSAVCVVIASGGYPDDYSTGMEISGLDHIAAGNDVIVFHSGTKNESGRILTAGGRVLGVTAIQRNGSLAATIDRAYKAVSMISFQGMHYRQDIGKRALVHDT